MVITVWPMTSPAKEGPEAYRLNTISRPMAKIREGRISGERKTDPMTDLPGKRNRDKAMADVGAIAGETTETIVKQMIGGTVTKAEITKALKAAEG